MKSFYSKILSTTKSLSSNVTPRIRSAIVIAAFLGTFIFTAASSTPSALAQETILTPEIMYSNFANEEYPNWVADQSQQKKLRTTYEDGKKKTSFMRIDMTGIDRDEITSAKLKLKLQDITEDFTNVNLYLLGVDERSGIITSHTNITWAKTFGSGGIIDVNKRLVKPMDTVLLPQKNTQDYIELDFTDFAKTTHYPTYSKDDYYSIDTIALCLMSDSDTCLIFNSELVTGDPMTVEIKINGQLVTSDIPTVPLYGLDDPSVTTPLQIKPPIPAYEDAIAYGGFDSTDDIILRYPIYYDTVDIDPSVPQYPTTVANSPLAPLGYVDVTLYGADPTGTTDSTQAIQNAVNDAYDYNMATYVPEGTYLISDTIDMYAPRFTFHNIRRRGNIMVGSTKGTATFKLTNNNTKFNGTTATNWKGVDNSTYLKPLLYLWKENYYSPGKAASYENYNNILRNITIDLGSGNPGAVGVRHRACEGSVLENITVHADGGYAGVHGMLGSGGIMNDITVYGGKYGIYSGGAQPSAALVGFHLVNQTEMAIYYKETAPLTLVGGKIEKDGGVFIGGMALHPHNNEMQEGSSLVSLYDVSMENTGSNAAIALENTNRGLYGINVYTKGIGTLISASDTSKNVYVTANDKWKHFEEFTWAKEYTRAMGFVDGVGVSASEQNILEPQKYVVSNGGQSDTVTKNVTENNFVNEKYPGTTVDLGNTVDYLGISNKSNVRRASFVRVDMSGLTQNEISKATLKLRLTGMMGVGESAEVYLCGITEGNDAIWHQDTITWDNTFGAQGALKQNPDIVVPLDKETLTILNGVSYFDMDFTDFARETALSNGTLSLMVCTDSTEPLRLAHKDKSINPVKAEITTNGSYTSVSIPTVPLNTLLGIGVDDGTNPLDEVPPSDLLSRHIYPYKETSIDYLDDNNIAYANIKNYGAVGDGLTDDTAAIQNAINNNKYVFIPRGVYKITDTISLKSDTRLFGVGKTVSIIRPVHTNSTLKPAMKTPNDSNADCIVSSFKVLLPNSNKNVGGVLWQSGSDSIIHGMAVSGTVDYDGQTPTYWIKVANNGGGRIYNVFAEGQHDTNHADSRLFLVEDTTNPLFVYHLHTQHIENQVANTELRNAENVAIFAVKSECSYHNPPKQPTVVWVKDSNNVLIMGYGGNYSATNGDGCIKLENSDNVTVCNMGRYMPHRNEQLNYYYVFETYNGVDYNSVDAEDYLSYYRRGQFSHISTGQ